jgi:hypothetical protein
MGSVIAGFLFLGGMFLILGATAIVATTRQLLQLRRLRERGIRVPGVVVEFKKVLIGDVYTLRPLLRFRAVDGQIIETVSKLSPGPLRGQEHPGQPVSVVYDPQKPATSVVGWVPRAGCKGAMGLVLGVVFLLVSLPLLSAGLGFR